MNQVGQVMEIIIIIIIWSSSSITNHYHYHQSLIYHYQLSSMYAMVHATADSIACQVALLPSYNGLCNSALAKQLSSGAI